MKSSSRSQKKNGSSWMRKGRNGLWDLAREKMLQDRGALSKEEGDVVREHKAMHEEKILSSWLKEVGQDKKERWRWTRRLKKR